MQEPSSVPIFRYSTHASGGDNSPKYLFAGFFLVSGDTATALAITTKTRIFKIKLI